MHSNEYKWKEVYWKMPEGPALPPVTSQRRHPPSLFFIIYKQLGARSE